MPVLSFIPPATPRTCGWKWPTRSATRAGSRACRLETTSSSALHDFRGRARRIAPRTAMAVADVDAAANVRAANSSMCSTGSISQHTQHMISSRLSRRLKSDVPSHRQKLGAPLAQQLLAGDAFHLLEPGRDLIGDGIDCVLWQAMGAAHRLGHDAIDHLEMQEILGGDLQCRRGFLRLVGAAPKDRGAAFRRDHRIDRMLQHVDAGRGRYGDGAARHAFAYDGSNERRFDRQSRLDRARNRFRLSAFFGRYAGIGTG